MPEEFRHAEPFRSQQEASFYAHNHLAQGFDEYFNAEQRKEDEALAKAGNPTDPIERGKALASIKEAEKKHWSDGLGQALTDYQDRTDERRNWKGQQMPEAANARALAKRHASKTGSQWLG